MNRHRLALCALFAALLLAGCGSGEIPESQLAENASYEWDTDATATFDISRSSYTAVVNVTNSSALSVWRRDPIEGDNPVSVRALQFRFPNGTVVNTSHANLTASREGDKTRIALPARYGRVGYSGTRGDKQFGTPAFVDGSYEFVLPPGARIGLPFLSQAGPGGYETTVDADTNRMTVRWANVTSGSVSVRYYLERDIFLFGGLVLVVLLAGGVGTVYYLRQIRELESRREEMGVDIDYDDDDFGDDGPPPGMR